MVLEKDGIVIETHYYCPPGLKRHRYFIDSMEQRVPDPGTPSGLLMLELKERERAAMQVQEPATYLDESHLSSDERVDRQEFNEFVEEIEKEEPKKKKRKIKALNRINRKIETFVFDDTPVKQGELEDEAYELLNQDGFYDEVLPIDYDEADPEKSTLPIKTIAIYSGVLIVLVSFLVWYVRTIIF